ncbi:MAG TPA: hypothetical protein VGM69_15540 [Chloroflexota bacterium]
MSQVNVTPPERGSDTGTVVAVVLVLLIVVVLVWALAFGGLRTITGAPAPSNPTVNVNPSVNVNLAPTTVGTSGTQGGTTGGAPALATATVGTGGATPTAKP